MSYDMHLTEDQIDDYLIGDVNIELTAHLSGCASCQARVAELEAPIESFKEVSLAWSERQSATMPIHPAGAKPKLAHGHRAIWAATATTALAIGIAVPLAHHAYPRPSEATRGPAAPAQTFAAERDQQIAQDNEMLQAIDRELGAPVNSPSETFGLDIEGRSSHGARPASVRD